MSGKIGKQIKRLRLTQGLSLTKLANRAGISKGYLSSIESHKANPSAHMIQKIAKALEVPVEQLLNTQMEFLDPEWVELFKQAKKLGIDTEDIRAFLTYETWKSLKEEV
ncbi:helix-turn-helix domain-containing protein [Fictibacillus sp. 23RED33]|uniref:helix-turn-helix domain-containing protein n=1 Tax=Fictibacillus sp. 23RED33 TaxID=2745879 RepID=UPI0018CEBD62|nr:helix-turn-helix domain-containing protein [Fictibacillus sp. 23RED33]MBH0173631.1 helix-turn-helix domain-containing protein [Fictibacillus sp. 23RED33]